VVLAAERDEHGATDPQARGADDERTRDV
jgi:hypothetical protein